MTIKTIVETIDQWAIKTPTSACFKDEQRTYSYKELKESSDSIGAYLAAHHSNDLPVIVYGGLGFEMIATFIACSKSGHAYVPIDSHTPAERVALIAEVVDYAAIFAWEEWPLANNGDQLISREQGLRMMQESQQLANPSYVNGNDNYYIIFTSGTTGIPKGVQISHDNLVSYTNWMLQDFGLTAGQTFLSQAPYSFDLSVMDVYPALLLGGQLVPLEKAIINDFKQLFTRLPQMELNVWVSTPSFADVCLLDLRFNEQEMTSVTHFLFCGEELTVVTAQKLQERFPHANIFNTYGPTEATVAISQIAVTPELLESHGRLPIGRVKTDTAVYIMDDAGQVVPEGDVGEMVIVGPSVSKGYYQNDAKTTEVFFDYQGSQAYRTGDAGTMKDGLLYYQGRMDFQIKLHGYRIELEDIDHHLSEVSYVESAIVVPKYHEHKVQQLVAYVVAKEHEFAKDYQLSKAIKEELKASVMEYMIPQKYVYVAALPLTQNGKIDRKKLINEVNAS